MQVLMGYSVPVPEERVGARVRGPRLIPHLQDPLYSVTQHFIRSPSPRKTHRRQQKSDTNHLCSHGLI